VYVFRWNELTLQWDDASAGLPVPTTDRYLISRLVDLDMDGYLDLVTGSSDSSTVLLYKGDGTSWTLMDTHYIPNMISIQDANIDDIDHNGYPDILLWTTIQTGWFSTENRLTLLMEESEPSELRITPSYPRNYECFQNDGVRFLQWVSAVPANHPSSVKIELSTTGNSGPWNVVAASAPNNGTYQWTVPSAVVSANCYMRYTLYDSTLSTSVFAVTTSPFGIGTCNFTTGVSKVTDISSIKVYPNPTTSSITVQSTKENQIESLFLYSMEGKLLESMVDGPWSIVNVGLHGFSAGIYFLDCKTENSSEKVKVVKY
jgi:hypothetical protein